MSLRYETETDHDAPAPQSPPFPVYTVILIASYGVVAALQFTTGLDRSILLAGFDKPVFIHQHEYWRILTGAALHGGVIHVAMNSYAFFSFGRIFEMLTNRAHLAIVFLLSAIGGGVLSLVLAPDGISVGASGGIVGLIGYLAVYAFRRRDFISPQFRKNLLVNIGFILLYGLAFYQTIDNYGHIGGLITGAVYAFAQVPGDPHIDPREAGQMTRLAGFAALGIYIAVCLFCVLRILSIV
jgi:membrane associated rhomboid family serine protease